MHFTFTSSKTTSGVSYTSPKNAKKRFGSFSFSNKSINDENKPNHQDTSRNQTPLPNKSPNKQAKPTVPLTFSNLPETKKTIDSNIISVEEVVKNSNRIHFLRSKSPKPSAMQNTQPIKNQVPVQKNSMQQRQHNISASVILCSPSKIERPFSGMQILLLGKLSWSISEAEAIIKKYGGTISSSISEKVTHILWNGQEGQLKEGELSLLQDARKRNYLFLSEDDVVNYVHFSSESSIDESPAKLLTCLERRDRIRKEKPIVKAKNEFDRLLILAEQNDSLQNNPQVAHIQSERLKRKGGVSPFKSTSTQETSFHVISTPPAKKLSLELEETTSNNDKGTQHKSNLKFTGIVFSLLGRNFTSRQEVIQLILNNGGTISKNVTKKVTHLLIAKDGDESSDKYQMAKERKLSILYEEDLYKML